METGVQMKNEFNAANTNIPGKEIFYINAQNFRHQKMAEILITSALAEVVNYAGEYYIERGVFF